MKTAMAPIMTEKPRRRIEALGLEFRGSYEAPGTRQGTQREAHSGESPRSSDALCLGYYSDGEVFGNVFHKLVNAILLLELVARFVSNEFQSPASTFVTVVLVDDYLRGRQGIFRNVEVWQLGFEQLTSHHHELLALEGTQNDFYKQGVGQMKDFLTKMEHSWLEHQSRSTPERQDDELVAEIGWLNEQDAACSGEARYVTILAGNRADLALVEVGLRKGADSDACILPPNDGKMPETTSQLARAAAFIATNLVCQLGQFRGTMAPPTFRYQA